MKNQYFGDVGDYGKYGMLRFLVSRDISLAVNWYLTADDGGNDGKHISYLDKPTERRFDDQLYDCLNQSVKSGVRNVIEFEKTGLLGSTVFYNELLSIPKGALKKDRYAIRDDWHQKGLKSCIGAQLVFFDPDNGLRDGEPTSHRDGTKYIYAEEAADYYRQGQNIVYYCHKGRRTAEKWETAKCILKKFLPDAVMGGVTFHRGTQRTYIFAVHPNESKKIYSVLSDFLHTDWGQLYTAEFVEGYDWTRG